MLLEELQVIIKIIKLDNPIFNIFLFKLESKFEYNNFKFFNKNQIKLN